MVAVSTAANGSPVQTVADVAGAVATALPTGGSIDAPIGTASAGPAVPEARMDPVRAVTRGAPPLITLSGYRWPIPKARLTLPFGPSPWGSRIVDGEHFHDGIDLATFCGDRIVAAHGGVVLAAGRHYDEHMGWVGDLTPYLERLETKHLWSTLPIVVVIDDGNGYRSMYAHFQKVTVKAGDRVKTGQLLGYEGRTGRASGCHLHYGLFSPLETSTFKMDPTVSKRMKLPTHQIARIDPLQVLPKRTKPTPAPGSRPTPHPSPGEDTP
ncbi:MAG TPA: M23 family metallopeptidase [Candidatus Saccharimonadales bacterium]|nr:M23 family metallopeptidase [Candidatus Saccharimonadales bacterium]